MSAPLEVVILHDFASVNGGSSSVALASARGLAEAGIPTTLLACVGPVAPEIASIPGLRTICLGQREIASNPRRIEAFLQGLCNRPAARALDRILEGKRPDRTIVHVHTWTKALSPLPLALAERRGFPVIVTLHDFFLACPNGGFFNHRSGRICELRPLSARCWSCRCDRRHHFHKLWRNLRTVLQNRLLRIPAGAAAFVAVSDFSLRFLRPHLPASVPVRLIRNPVAATDDGPAPVAGNREFLAVGRFEREKGMRLFAEAARVAEVPATFIGDGTEGPLLRKVYPQGRFTGWLGRKEVAGELRRARAFVFSPSWPETLGLSALEAIAAGVPPIVSDRCAATDYVRDGGNGLHFRHDSVGSLAAGLRRLAEDPGLAAHLGRNGYDQYWADPWTVDRHIGELLRLYRDVLEGTDRQRARN